MTHIKLPIFPLSGVILFPSMQIPLHIFEPRYRDMVGQALAKDRLIGLIQPQEITVDQHSKADAHGKKQPQLFTIGTVGRIADVEAMEDGRYNIVLEGVQRFTVVKELDVTTAFRQIEAALWSEKEASELLSLGERAALEMEGRKFAEAQGYKVDWESVIKLDDHTLVNAIAQIAPFDMAAKQALLEVDGMAKRCELLVQLMQFYGRHDGDEKIVTLQ
ncbi:ATP-dependent protease [Sphingorhabdus lutea]|uniref:ATP-dependent protease n=1 Tax=Sphingorhabdus lutea TaxID=1913578 RepID=A0A1L3JED8_9SPHN|nr:LON peptidase substrate-binding domain-containing protein [Sphingorhabdus lutea]APG63486.1 ATP-dependent protease [Sphingorhabdus lutea]